jgi:hypothetical protein
VSPSFLLRQTSPPDTGELWHHHVSHEARPHLLTREGDGVATCPTLPDPASRHRRAPTSPRVPWHQARLPTREGSGVATCPMALDPSPGTRGLQHRHVPRGARPRLPARENSGVATCHMALGVLWATSKREILNRLLTWINPPASKVCPCVP